MERNRCKYTNKRKCLAGYLTKQCNEKCPYVHFSFFARRHITKWMKTNCLFQILMKAQEEIKNG